MRISWNILRTLADTGTLTPRQAADVLTSTGLEVEHVEALEPIKGMLEGVVVGHVLACDRHPDADRLSICQVDTGEGEPKQIICGAPNVAAGQKVLVATVGATLCTTDGTCINIKKAKIRGVESQGMICAEDELGIGTSHEGILVLDPSVQVGTPAAVHLGLRSDQVLEIGLTPNRSDALGHWGVARDLAAAQRARGGVKVTLQRPDVSAFAQDDATRALSIEVQAPHVALRYAGVTLTHITVGPSPAWLQDALKSLGLKSINNVVDVTNYVQHELGQPLHAFDADKLTGGQVVVRMAREGEAFTTLDGKERKLASTDLVIADTERAACLAGVLGGADSGVSDGTTAVFLESACFDATHVRRTARRHGINSDASFRFERGVDPEITVYALQRAALLLKEVAGARISSPVTDLYPAPLPWRAVELSFERLANSAGVRLEPRELQEALEALDCRVRPHGAGFMVEVPPYRVDVHREADLVEEVLRIVGFDRIPLPHRLMVPSVRHPETTLDGFQRQVALHFAARGFQEVMNPSLVSGDRCQRLDRMAPQELVQLKNPLSTELDVLRPSMVHGLLQSAAYNIARQQRDLRLFEKGRVYRVVNGASVEVERTALLLTGARNKAGWRGGAIAVAQPDAKAEVELLLERLGVEGVVLKDAEQALYQRPLLVEGPTGMIGTIGRVTRAVREAFGVEQEVYIVELDDAVLFAALQRNKPAYSEVPKFPAVRRDLSLLLDVAVPYAELERIAYKAERQLLRNVELFDVYEGDKLPKGKKSYALAFTLQDPARTLTDDIVEKSIGRIRQALEKGVGAELRG